MPAFFSCLVVSLTHHTHLHTTLMIVRLTLFLLFSLLPPILPLPFPSSPSPSPPLLLLPFSSPLLPLLPLPFPLSLLPYCLSPSPPPPCLYSNTDIHLLPLTLGRLRNCWELILHGLKISNVPQHLMPGVTRGGSTKHLLAYLRAQLRHCVPYNRMKLMLVGLQVRGGWGGGKRGGGKRGGGK